MSQKLKEAMEAVEAMDDTGDYAIAAKASNERVAACVTYCRQYSDYSIDALAIMCKTHIKATHREFAAAVKQYINSKEY